MAAQPDARLLGILPFLDRDPRPVPIAAPAGDGLDARQFTDLSTLGPGALVTPTPRFFVRTRARGGLARPASWRVRVGGLDRDSSTFDLAALRPLARPQGVHLLECAGNVEPFGLMSAARWDGIPLRAVLDRMAPWPAGHRVLVTGDDDASYAWRTSVAGASWIFSSDDLTRTGAFLATGMNDEPLTPDHGGPLRLVVPGWYACSAIKWVVSIDWVHDEALATGQMREFAGRTHQRDVPRLARDYEPPAIDTAAMPVRVEQWQNAGGVFYRLVGIVWGGTVPTNALEVQCGAGAPFVPVSECPLPSTTSTWSLWTHNWRPGGRGVYEIAVRVRDAATPTRRLDRGYYIRRVRVAAV
ncbi:MAG: molybdopterin-dependent oxidoreductase [Vicinamibacterales bacterium]